MRAFKWIAIPGGLFYGICFVFGRQADAFGEVRLQDPTVLLETAAASIAAGLVLLLLWKLTDRLVCRDQDKELICSNAKNNSISKEMGACFLILWILYFIVFLGVYPGFFVYDAHDELMEMVTRNFSNQHPPIHVLGLGIVIQGIHKITGNYNIAIAVYILLQMTLAAAFFAWLIAEFRKSEKRWWCSALLLLYFGIFPVHVMYVLCSVKDGIFAAFLAAAVVMFRRMGDYVEGISKAPAGRSGSVKEEIADPAGQNSGIIRENAHSETGSCGIHCLLLVGCTAMMMLYRNNGVYAYLVFSVILAAYFIRCLVKQKNTSVKSWEENTQTQNNAGVFQKNIEETVQNKCTAKLILRALIILAAPVLLYAAVNRGIRTFITVSEVGHREMLAVPIQQMARIYAYDQGSLTKEEKEVLEKYLPEEALLRYRPKCVDPVKISFQEAAYQADPAAFYRLYLKLGKEHPSAYLNAWVMTSYGIWYPWTVIDGYKGNSVFTYTYGDSSYFGYETEAPGTRKSLIPAIDRFYRWLSLDPSIQKMPVIHLLFSPGFIVWLYLFCVGYLFYAGRWRRALPYLLPVLVWMTFLLGPMSLVRYVYYLWILMPLIATDIFDQRYFISHASV